MAPVSNPDPILHNPDFWTTVNVVEKLKKKKLCIASNLNDCEGAIVEAHTIPRSQLTKIATNGKVYEIAANPVDLARNDGEYTFRERGVGQFSVLNCFCEKHDREIFSPIENEPLVFDTRQLSVLHYRAMGAELYKKATALDVSDHLIQHSKKRNPRRSAATIETARAGVMMGVQDIGAAFELCEQAVFTPAHGNISGLIIRFKRKPTLMAVGGFTPEYGYNGAPVAQLSFAQPPPAPIIGLSVLATTDGAAAVFSWLREAKLCHAFAETLIAQPPDLITTLIIQTAFEQVENTCMKKEWWNALVPAEQKALLRRAKSGLERQPRLSTSLQFDGVCHDQWDYQGHVFVNCH